MGIRWDSVLARAVAAELNRTLGGSRLRRIGMDHGQRDLRLYLKDRILVFRLHPERGYVLSLDAGPAPEDSRPLKARILGITAPPDDRRIDFRLQPDRGRSRAALGLSVVLKPNAMNAWVWEGDARVTRMALVQGAPTPPIEETGSEVAREGIDGAISASRWAELLAAAGDDPRARGRALLAAVAWTSGINVDALVGTGEEPLAGHPLWAALAGGTAEGPVLLMDGQRGPQPYPIALPHLESRAVPGLLQAMEESARQGSDDGIQVLHSPATSRAVAKEIKRRRKVLGSLRREFDTLPDSAETRARGDLILARLRDVTRGSERVTLTGFDGAPVEIELDPRASPQENADAYYRRARRAEKARAGLPPRIEAAEVALKAGEALRERMQDGTATPDEVAAVVPTDRPAPRRGEDPRRLPYKSYRSSGGLEIRVGRGSKWNDALTFQHARPNDVWLHARQSAGAHVVLRWDAEGAPPARDLEEAAILAALNSKARGSGTVAVAWTRRKYVRKPRKAPPGTVLPERDKTIFVSPDPELEDRLTEER